MSCGWPGYQRNEEAWQVLITAISEDQGRDVRAESGQCPGQYGVERAWPLLRDAFAVMASGWCACSILSALG